MRSLVIGKRGTIQSVIMKYIKDIGEVDVFPNIRFHDYDLVVWVSDKIIRGGVGGIEESLLQYNDFLSKGLSFSRFIFISSVSVDASFKSNYWSIYSASKFLQEQVFAEYCKANDVDFFVLRLNTALIKGAANFFNAINDANAVDLNWRINRNSGERNLFDENDFLFRFDETVNKASTNNTIVYVSGKLNTTIYQFALSRWGSGITPCLRNGAREEDLIFNGN